MTKNITSRSIIGTATNIASHRSRERGRENRRRRAARCVIRNLCGVGSWAVVVVVFLCVYVCVCTMNVLLLFAVIQKQQPRIGFRDESRKSITSNADLTWLYLFRMHAGSLLHFLTALSLSLCFLRSLSVIIANTYGNNKMYTCNILRHIGNPIVRAVLLNCDIRFLGKFKPYIQIYYIHVNFQRMLRMIVLWQRHNVVHSEYIEHLAREFLERWRRLHLATEHILLYGNPVNILRSVLFFVHNIHIETE